MTSLVRTSVLVALAVDDTAWAGTPTTFASGSLVVPMDQDLQDEGILDAYGLVYEMLRRGIPVSWVIDGDKVRDGNDLVGVPTHLTTEAPAAATARSFRGGPWVVAASDATEAAAVVAEWRGMGHDAVAYVATAPFSGEVSRRLFAAPSIVIYEDGNEDIAWDYLNAASIPDLDGNVWTETSAYNLSDAELVGPNPAVPGDGALFDEDGLPNYCHLNAMHYRATDAAPVTIEFRRFAEDPLVSFLTECEASTSMENDPIGGHMLSTGIAEVGTSDNGVVSIDNPSDELVQVDGPWAIVGGSVPEFDGTFNADVHFITVTDDDMTSRLLAYGHLDGDATKGKVAFLAGHQYDVDVPYSSNDELNGVRVFLNSYFTARCTELADAPVVSIDGTPEATGSDVTLVLDWANDGTGRGRDGTLTLEVPPGLTYVSDSAGGVYDPITNTITWDLGTMTGGEAGSITIEFEAAGDSVDTFEATLRYRVEATWFEETWTGTIAHGPDSDGDGLLDVEEELIDTNPADTDSDDDGITDGGEVDGGTDPTDADTDDDGLTDGGEIVTKTDPRDPDTDDDGLSDGGEVNTHDTDPLDTDTDDDGLSDGGEITAGSDPLDTDSDDDGLLDGDEVNTHGTDPTKADSDGDALEDGDEVVDHGTDPADPDTDDDGLDDGDEIDTHDTDPLDSDTDNDGLTDGDEVNTHDTDPLDRDTDDGGVSDGVEVLIDGTDPHDPTDDVPGADTDGDGLSDDDEGLLGTDPGDTDSDDDGLDDGDEVVDLGTEPLDTDSDDDGLDDGAEVTLGTDPTDPDTDDGGVGDGDEVDAGTDPLDGTDDLGGDTDDPDTDDPDTDDVPLDDYTYNGRANCGCTTPATPAAPWLALALALWARRRR